jgi:hypothetical protein
MEQIINRFRTIAEKELFIYTNQLTIHQWREIRTKEYWLEIDDLKGIYKTEAVVRHIKRYLNE